MTKPFFLLWGGGGGGGGGREAMVYLPFPCVWFVSVITSPLFIPTSCISPRTLHSTLPTIIMVSWWVCYSPAPPLISSPPTPTLLIFPHPNLFYPNFPHPSSHTPHHSPANLMVSWVRYSPAPPPHPFSSFPTTPLFIPTSRIPPHTHHSTLQAIICGVVMSALFSHSLPSPSLIIFSHLTPTSTPFHPNLLHPSSIHSSSHQYGVMSMIFHCSTPHPFPSSPTPPQPHSNLTPFHPNFPHPSSYTQLYSSHQYGVVMNVLFSPHPHTIPSHFTFYNPCSLLDQSHPHPTPTSLLFILLFIPTSHIPPCTLHSTLPAIIMVLCGRVFCSPHSPTQSLLILTFIILALSSICPIQTLPQPHPFSSQLPTSLFVHSTSLFQPSIWCCDKCAILPTPLYSASHKKGNP